LVSLAVVTVWAWGQIKPGQEKFGSAVKIVTLRTGWGQVRVCDAL
jgi:hypothetical protein